MSNVKRVTGTLIKEMLKKAYTAGYEGCIDFMEEEVEAILKEYLKPDLADMENKNYWKSYYPAKKKIKKDIVELVDDAVWKSFKEKK